jgi:hypothetical protein
MLSQRTQSDGDPPNHTFTDNLTTESDNPSHTPLPLKTSDSRNDDLNDDSRRNSIEEYNTHLRGEDPFNTSEIKSTSPEIETANDVFPALDKIFDPWDTADNEWLYSLQTECARPGAVCECGDSCCCPGCFTHTNNPGDRGVYNTMVNKLGAILEKDKEERETQHNKPCISVSKQLLGNQDAKL